MKKIISLACATSLILMFTLGCSDTSDPVNGEEAAPSSEPATRTGPTGYLQTTVAQRGRAEEVSGLRSVQQVVDMFSFEEERHPRNVAELLEKGYLERLPPLPRGREFVLDPQTGKVEIKDVVE